MPWGPAVYARAMHYVAFASGYHMYAWAGARGSLDETWEHYRFAARYCEYLYSPRLRALPVDQDRVAVEPSEGILWKYFVYVRPVASGGQELIVDLVNLPEDELVLWHYDPPPVRGGIRVRAQLLEGQTLRDAWALVPEPQPRSVKLDVDVRGNEVSARVPPLRSIAVVVFRFAA